MFGEYRINIIVIAKRDSTNNDSMSGCTSRIDQSTNGYTEGFTTLKIGRRSKMGRNVDFTFITANSEATKEKILFMLDESVKDNI